MSKVFFLSALLLACAGCSSQSTADLIEEPPAQAMSGAEAYEQQCAGCHETGMLGAPAVGNQADWDERSRLWQPVLKAHARNGYLDMPAKGGRPDLPDATIDAAVEHMLKLTYPDMPTDE